MRSTSPITTNTFKAAALALALFATTFTACKKSADEDFAPQETTSSTESVVSANDLGETAEKGSYHLKGYTLKQVFDFPIGAAVVYERLKNEPYNSTLKREFSRVSSESNFKFHMLQPKENQFVFTKADEIVKFAQENKMQVHGHTLIWALDGVTPAWVLNHKGGAKEFDQLLKNHIYTVVKHFKGKVTSWDVVNEALTPSGGYVDNIWLRKLGEGYLLKAFQYASEADPKAKLFANDYSQEFGGKKLKKYLKIADEARAKGIRFDGLGYQMHTVLRIDANQVQKSFEMTAAKGLLVHISEMDVALRYQKPKTFDLTDSLSRAQGAKYKELVYAYLNGVPKNLRWGITTWGVADKDSYFNKGYADSNHDYPLLFGKDYKAKWAYRGFIEAGLGR
jgi:endo-1,4-beta-xylanase